MSSRASIEVTSSWPSWSSSLVPRYLLHNSHHLTYGAVRNHVPSSPVHASDSSVMRADHLHGAAGGHLQGHEPELEGVDCCHCHWRWLHGGRVPYKGSYPVRTRQVPSGLDSLVYCRCCIGCPVQSHPEVMLVSETQRHDRECCASLPFRCIKGKPLDSTANGAVQAL
jgi:hypothetical protein